MPHVPADERSRQIIEAASAIITREGLARATTRRIAQEAGAPLASLHYTFRNKEELCAGVYEHWIGIASERLADLVPEGCGLEVAVRNLATGVFDWYAEDPNLAIAQYELFLWALRTPSARNLASSVYARYFGVFTDALARATNGRLGAEELEELTTFIACALDGVFIKMLSAGDVDAARRTLDRLIAIAVTLGNDTTP